MKLAIIGTGYVGLVSGAGFANLGHDVVCLDIDDKKIERLKAGEPTIFEPGLTELLVRNMESKRLIFSTDMEDGIKRADIVFICVGTPAREDGNVDMSAVKEAAKTVGQHINGYKIIANKSTVPIGTTDLVKKIVKENSTGKFDFDVVSNPEFLREGAAVKDFENPDRIVIGTDSQRAKETMLSLYKPVSRTNRPIVVIGCKSAELVKYAANSMLAARISFMNQLTQLCEKTGADIKDIARGIGLDSRIGPRFLHAGAGYGGSCFPKDVKALVSMLKDYGCNAELFEAIDTINERQYFAILEKLESLLPAPMENSVISVWGLAFKPKTDDIRESPAIEIVKELLKKGAGVCAYDPVALDNAKKEINGAAFFNDRYEAINDCDALVVMTEWDEFRNADMKLVKKLLKHPVVIDGRNIYEPDVMKTMGFSYSGIGRAIL